MQTFTPIVRIRHFGYGYASNNPTTYSDPTGLIPRTMLPDMGGGGFIIPADRKKSSQLTAVTRLANQQLRAWTNSRSYKNILMTANTSRRGFNEVLLSHSISHSLAGEHRLRT